MNILKLFFPKIIQLENEVDALKRNNTQLSLDREAMLKDIAQFKIIFEKFGIDCRSPTKLSVGTVEGILANKMEVLLKIDLKIKEEFF